MQTVDALSKRLPRRVPAVRCATITPSRHKPGTDKATGDGRCKTRAHLKQLMERVASGCVRWSRVNQTDTKLSLSTVG